MRTDSHTAIAIIRNHVNAWRKRMDWSRETVSQELVDYFQKQDGEQATGIKFDPPTRDIYERTKVNADRIYRWLDDEGKDTNLLPANFIPYLLGALPMDLRISCVDQLLIGTGLSIRVADGSMASQLPHILKVMAQECGEAQATMIGLLDGADPEELLKAQKEMTEAVAALNEGLRLIEAMRMGQA